MVFVLTIINRCVKYYFVCHCDMSKSTLKGVFRGGQELKELLHKGLHITMSLAFGMLLASEALGETDETEKVEKMESINRHGEKSGGIRKKRSLQFDGDRRHGIGEQKA